jgi:hypothetical protein
MLAIYVRDSRRWIENVTILQPGDLQDWRNAFFLTIRKVYFDIRDVDKFAQVYTKYVYRLTSWSLSKPWITFDTIRTNTNVTITITTPVYNCKEFWLHKHVRWRMTVGNSQRNWTIWVRIYTVMDCSFSWPAVEGVALKREIRPWYRKFME